MGSNAAQYFVDGYQADPASPDTQALMRFDNIIGNGPGQIPANATVLSATLTVNTSTVTNAQSPGPWAVAKMLEPFDGTTTYFDNYNCGGCALGSRGPWWQDGYTDRPVAAFGNNWAGDRAVADITGIVQSWLSGEANHGITIQTGHPTGTADGWSITASGHPVVERRPQLSVTYTTDPVEVNTFQRGLNNYMGDTLAYVKSGNNIYGTVEPPEPNSALDDITYNGATGEFTVAPNSTVVAPAPLTQFQQFLDGPQFPDTTGVANSVFDFAMLKFGGVFGEGANQAPSDVPVAKAWLVLTTGDLSNDARSGGEWSAHPVLRNWDTTTLHSSLGDRPGLQEFDGDIGPALDTEVGIVFGSEVWFDVTSYLEGVRNGAPDNGLAVLSTATADGWQIHLNGSDQAEFRPRLIVNSGNPAIVVPGLSGDYNSNGVVDAADYVMWRNNLDQQVTLPNDTTPGTVSQADYDVWRANFGQMADIGGPLGTGAAVPEPGTWLLALAAVAMASVASRRQKQ
jgi:hypothetical protein